MRPAFAFATIAATFLAAARLLAVSDAFPSAAVAASSQSALLKPQSQPQHVVVAASPPATVAPGETMSLWVDVTPRPGVHVYAAGARDFTPVAIVPTPLDGITFLRATFALSTLVATLGAAAPVPAYRSTFRITQPLRVERSVTRGRKLTLAAAVNYQACDERLCYPVGSVPVLWSVTVQ